MLAIAQRRYDAVRDKGDKPKSTTRDVGFDLPYEFVETCYWARIDFGVWPDDGGLLDQEERLFAAIQYYGWLYNMAYNTVAHREKQAELVRQKGNRP